MKRHTLKMSVLGALLLCETPIARADETPPSREDRAELRQERRQERQQSRQEDRQERRRVRAGRTTVTVVDEGEAFDDVISRIRTERQQQKAERGSADVDRARPVEVDRTGDTAANPREQRALLREQRRDPSANREQRQRIRERIREIRANREASGVRRAPTPIRLR